MAEDILPPTGPASPPNDAPAVAHIRWCETFGLYCSGQAQLARDDGLSDRKWLRAAEFAAFAAAAWRERI